MIGNTIYSPWRGGGGWNPPFGRDWVGYSDFFNHSKNVRCQRMPFCGLSTQ